MAKPKPKAKKKRVRHMKMANAEVTLHLDPQGGRVRLSVILPTEISKILARRVTKRTK